MTKVVKVAYQYKGVSEMIKSKDDIPETIWLQWANDDGEVLHPDEQTWCQEQIYDTDVKYVKEKSGCCVECGEPLKGICHTCRYVIEET